MNKRILHIARWCSARVYKQVLCQQDAGWDVTLMAGQSPHPDLHAMVDSQIGWCNAVAMRGLVYDVVVVHTTVSTFSDAHDLILPGANVYIWDCHDYCGSDPQTRFDIVTCPSESMAKCFTNGVCIYSKVPMALFPSYTGYEVDAVVFAGTMDNGEPWGDYDGLEERLGLPVIFYPSGPVAPRGKKVMQRLPYTELLTALTMYKYGYAGASRQDVSIHDCVTNKYWEYKAAGITVITYNSDEMTELERRQWTNISLSMESELGKMEAVCSSTE